MGLIRLIIDLYVLLLIVDAILSYLPQFKNHPIVVKIRMTANFTLKPVRKIMPADLPFDFSPVIVIIALKLFVALF